ncbi:MAG: cytochrome C biogenesis protein CcdA [Candidatus Bathyarchaeum sp.]|nr:MAG: cytochrome C biogenesis protein CcdA [Candidatus Bathyarchaeum sp.]
MICKLEVVLVYLKYRGSNVFVGELMSYNIVIMTAPNKQEAAEIVHTLLEERLIACANILDSVQSFFWWKGKIDEENEAMVVMKSHSSLFEKLSKRVLELHSYDTPEILALPVVNGSQSYLDWMKHSLESVK